MDVSVVVGTVAVEWDRLTVQDGLHGGSSNPPLFHHEGLHDEPVHRLGARIDEEKSLK